MTKQIRITTDSLSPLFKASVGFDRLVNEFFNEPQANHNLTGYPPYNISKDENDIYEITLAVAGFKKSDASLTGKSTHESTDTTVNKNHNTDPVS